MLVRRGIAGCILACFVTLLLALTALGTDDVEALRATGLYAFLGISLLVFLAGEAVPAMGKSPARGLAARGRKVRIAAEPQLEAGETNAPPASVDDLVKMLDDALKLSQPVPVVERLEPVDLADLLGAVAKRQSSTRLELRVRPRPFHTLASRPAIARALEILVENALANGTRACVECDYGTSAVVVHVDDDGPGVARSERAHVFEWRHYMSTPPSRQIGCRAELVIARQILRTHGGDIVVGCSPLGGGRFTARLPLLGEHESVLAQAS